MAILEQFGSIPIEYAVLATALGGYKSPKDKIANMEKKGDLIRLKKGLYVVSPEISHTQISRELIANHLYGPSYVSLESVLSFYGLIPEKVYTIRSMVARRSKNFSTPLGDFEYVSCPVEYFSMGIRQEIVDNQYAYLIASPEKAICDMIVATHSLRLQSVKAMQIYLEEDLRIDFSVLETFDMDIVRQCIATGKKKTELTQLLKFLER